MGITQVVREFIEIGFLYYTATETKMKMIQIRISIPRCLLFSLQCKNMRKTCMSTNFFSFHLVLYRVTAKAHNSYIHFCSGFIPCFRYYENYKTCLETFRGNCSGYHIYKGELYQWKWLAYLDCPRLLGEQPFPI